MLVELLRGRLESAGVHAVCFDAGMNADAPPRYGEGDHPKGGGGAREAKRFA